MSAHFSVLQEAGLVETEKVGRTIWYRLKMSVLEDALLGFAHTLGWNPAARARTAPSAGRALKRRAVKAEG